MKTIAIITIVQYQVLSDQYCLTSKMTKILKGDQNISHCKIYHANYFYFPSPMTEMLVSTSRE